MKNKDSDGKTILELKTENKTLSEIKKDEFDSINEAIPDDMKPYVKHACDKAGASSWLNALSSIREQNLDLNKEKFKDASRLRYNIPLKKLPTTCPCGVRFDVTHALSCQKSRLHS